MALFDSSERTTDALLLTGAFCVLYALTAVPHLLGGDMGVFATLFADGGHAFPPGYPLYSLYLRAMSWLPAASPAHGASLATALLGAASIGVLYLACRAWEVGRFAAGFAGVAFGVSTYVWFIHTQPEVFALNHLLAAGLLWLCAPDPPVEGRRRMALLGATAGLGLAHHQTIVFMTPIGLYAVWRCARGSETPYRDLALGAGCLAVGLASPYGYVLYVTLADAGWHWGEATGLAGLVDLFLRRDYGTFQLTRSEDTIGALGQIGFLLRSVPGDMLYLPAALGLGGLGLAARRACRDPDRRWSLIWLAASLLLAGPFFVSLIGRRPDGIDYLHIRKFHLLFECLLVPFVAFGASRLGRYVEHATLRGAVVAAVFVLGVVAGLPFLTTHQRPTVAQYVHDTFETLPDEAVVVGTGDHHFFGALYLKRGLKRREDVDYLDAKLLAYRWYNRRARERLGIEFPYRGEDIDTSELFAEILETGRPLFITHRFYDGVLDGWLSAPVGTLVRVYPSDRRPPPPGRLLETNLSLLESFEVEPVPEAPETSWARYVLNDYAGTWRVLADALERTGATRRAARARDVASTFEGSEGKEESDGGGEE